MKRLLALLMALLMPLALLCCSPGSDTPEGPSDSGEKTVELTLATYPIGGWGNSATVSPLLTAFRREHPEIQVSLVLLTYETGDAEIEEMIKNGKAPDIVLEGPERLSANWGERGIMADISDLWGDGGSDGIYGSVREACIRSDGKSFIYPLCMTTHCMAINRDLFEAADAWKYIDEETHTWSTDDFLAAVAALRSYGVEEVADIYCGGQGGDQGTRALVTNMYGGTFTDPQHTRYTVNSPENIRALNALFETDGIVFDPEIVGSDEIDKFCRGELAMAFCWNVFMEIRETVSGQGIDFDVFPMAFPTNEGEPKLQGGIWGFGVFDNGDADKIEAAKTFIKFMTGDSSRYERSVLASTYWPVRDVGGIYDNDKLMNEYGIFGSYLGDYYQVTPRWADARTAWWQMLQKVGSGTPPADAVAGFESALGSE